MAKKKQQKAQTPSAKSASSAGSAGTADVTQVQSLLAKSRTTAKALHSSQDQEQVEAALQPINSTSEATQIALLKLLSKEQNEDAADIVLAINEFSPSKEIRKEARRSLIRLQEVHIYPQWQPPLKRTPLVEIMEASLAAINPPRFWKGVVTDSRDIGEVSLMLLWEQGENYREVLLQGFLLDFGIEGVKDYFTDVDNKRRMDEFISSMSAKVPTISCSLARAQSLIREALAVNKRFSIKLPSDYNRHQSLINDLILEASDIGEMTEDELARQDEETLLGANLEPPTVVTSFVAAWTGGNYQLAYTFLANSSELREGLSSEEWAARRQEWAEEAKPDNLIPGFIYEREVQKSKLWLPNSFNRNNAPSDERKEFEAGWSIELANDSALNASLPELPKPTNSYKENGRCWFWANFTLVKEEDVWHIQSMADEGAALLSLSVKELQARIKEADKQVEDITKKHKPTDPDAMDYFDKVMWNSMRSLYYEDVLITKTPLDEALYHDAAGRAMILGEHERSIAYLERLIEQLPELRGSVLLEIAALQIQLSEAYYAHDEDDFSDEDDVDEEEAEEERIIVDSELSRGQRFYELAKATVEESLRIEESPTAHIILADLLIDNEEGEELEAAEDHLEQAQALTDAPALLAQIEYSLGSLEMEREQYEHALRHYQQVLEYDPNFPDTWYQIGSTYHALGNEEESIHAFQHSIQVQPTLPEAYTDMADIYVRSGRFAEARATLEQGLKAIPNSAYLYIMLSATYISDNPQRAEELLDKAESLDPNSELVQMYRRILDATKQQLPEKNQRGKKLKKR